MTALALLRHGHTAWNRAGRVQGRSDIPLDDDARTDLAALALPAPWDRAALVASPLMRARHTAQLVAGRDPGLIPALTEMHWGNWEGRHAADLRADPACDHRDIDDWGWDYRPPGGETPREVRARLVPWLATLRQDTVAVCHIGIMRVLMATASDWDFDGPAPFRIKRARLYILRGQGADWRLEPEPVRLVRRAP